ncbi:MAG: Gfo/Idh/MocA family oxidoreductase [Clostridia bacterium]|nr:Gfo/Idh/MocA family oxidoreductase [Clostridia bacterium]
MQNNEKIKVAVVGIGYRGIWLLKYVLNMPDVDVLAVCDTNPAMLEDAKEAFCEKKRDASATLFTTDYNEAFKIEEINAVIVGTFWNTHIAIAIAAMEAGKDVAFETGGACTIEECWQLVHAAEKTGRQCMMLENCNYGRRELAVLNMARMGKFGRIVHATGGYAHDLRSNLSMYAKDNRTRHINYIHRNCENYPQHAFGPLAKVLDINRGNRIVSLTSMASCACGLEYYADTQLEEGHPLKGKRFKQGDIVTTTIKCANGETVVLTLDTTLPRCYSRHFGVQGTKGFSAEDGKMMYFDDEHNHDMKSSDLYNNETEYFDKYDHPLWKIDEEKKMDQVVSANAGGHGSMDKMVLRAFLESVRDGIEVPIDVYDCAAWMAITVLSEESIAKGSMPVTVPDFTRGKWMLRKFEQKSKWSI